MIQQASRFILRRPAALGSAFLLWLLCLPGSAPAAPTAKTVVQHYAAIVEASYADSLAFARRMQSAIDAFLAHPSVETLNGARDAWREAREWYGQTEVYRFYGGPIDGRDGPESRINAWPLDEAYVDSVRDRPEAGIINDRTVRIDARQLIRLNEFGGEENVATGWHAIEFLLWGQDFDASGPGARLYTDYVDQQSRNADRRRTYLRVATALLVQDLAGLRDAWRPGRRNYRMTFERADAEGLRRIVVGLGSLARAELAGERLEVALATQDQEDEHSCFSDNTHRDLIANARGLENVWLGRYHRGDGAWLEGPALRDLVAARDAEIAELTTRALNEVLAAVHAIQPPFDQEVRGGDEAPGRQRIRAAVDSLKRFSQNLASSASALGIKSLTLVQQK